MPEERWNQLKRCDFDEQVARCPLCGSSPGWHDFEIECKIENAERNFFCCRYSAYGIRRWNYYAAVMELAEAKAWQQEVLEALHTPWDEHIYERIVEKGAREFLFNIDEFSKECVKDAEKKFFEVLRS